MVIKVCSEGSTQEGRTKVDRDARKPEGHDDQDNQDGKCFFLRIFSPYHENPKADTLTAIPRVTDIIVM